MAWAAYILKHWAAEQDGKMKGPPPQLIHLFYNSSTSSESLISHKNQNVLILGVLDSLSEEEERNFAQLKALHEKRLAYIAGMRVLVQATIRDIQVSENHVSLSYASQIEK